MKQRHGPKLRVAHYVDRVFPPGSKEHATTPANDPGSLPAPDRIALAPRDAPTGATRVFRGLGPLTSWIALVALVVAACNADDGSSADAADDSTEELADVSGDGSRQETDERDIDADGGEAVALTSFGEGTIRDHKWSPDGRSLAVAYRETDPDWTEAAKKRKMIGAKR